MNKEKNSQKSIWNSQKSKVQRDNPSQTLVSKDSQQYRRLLNTDQCISLPLSSIASVFLEEGIKYNPFVFQEAIDIVVMEHTCNYEILTIGVSYGKFKFDLNVINIDQKCPVNQQDCTKGGFGSVYYHQQKNRSVAIKFIKIYQPFEIGLRQTIKEYLFLAIASALKIGPKLIKIFSFDILIFRDYFAFTMESCEMLNYKINDSLATLKEKLHLLHKFNIVHLDIKPENIGFSPSFNQYIFIDFGLSRMVKEEIGLKSFTNFVGSFSFCSLQMLELFETKKNGFADLYFNDAVCLKKSLDAMQCQQEIQGSQQYQINRTYTKKINKLSAKMKDKMTFKTLQKVSSQSYNIIYKNSFNEVAQTVGESIQQDKYQFMNFIGNADQSAKLTFLYKKQLKKMYHTEQIRNYDSKIKISMENYAKTEPFFHQRFSTIQRLKYYQNQQIALPNNLNLSEINQIKQITPEIYKLMLIKYIRINNQVQQFSQKLKACLVYKELFMKNGGNIQGVVLYKQTVKHIFENIIKCTQKEAYQILYYSIQTIILLELVTQQIINNTLDYILQRQIDLAWKLNICFKFFQSFQFIKQKYRSNYNYYRFKDNLMNKLDEFIEKGKKSISKQQEIKAIQEFKLIFSFKKSLKDNHFSKSDFFDFFKVVKMSYLQNSSKNHIKQLSKSIMLHFINIYAKIQLQQNNEISVNTFIILLFIANASNNNFSHLHFFLYDLAYYQNQYLYTKEIYWLFLSKFKEFQEYKDFNLYLVNRLIQIQNEQANNRIMAEKSEQLFVAFDQIIKTSANFHSYLKYFFILITIQNSLQCLHLIQRLIQENKQKVTQLSLNFSVDHQKQIKAQIYITNNILQIMHLSIPKQQFLERACTYIQNCESQVKNINCFKCKVHGLLQMLKGFAIIIRVQGKVEQSFLHLIDLLVFCTKHHQFTYDALNILTVNLIFLWTHNEYLYRKYDLRLLIYDFITIKKVYMYCLIDLRFYDIFTNLYYLIEQKKDIEAMIIFFKNILNVLNVQRSKIFIRNFYLSWRSIIQGKKKKIKRLFYDHRLIIQYFLKKLKKPFKNPYYSLYFSPFLEISFPFRYRKQLLTAIAKSLNSLDSFPKMIIMNRYYSQYNLCFGHSQRMKKYIFFKHLKKSCEKYYLKDIMNYKIKIKSDVYGIYTKKIGALKHCIKIYYQNLGNLI